MKIEIENYRDWMISFDTEKETFYCYSDQYDRSESKKSFAATKKFIDEFIKDNKAFNPIWIESKPKSYGQKKIKLIGIRKDGKFIYEDSKGEKKQLPDYSEKDYILYNEENEKYKIEANEIDEKIEQLKLEKNNILDKIKGIELTEYKKQLFI